MEIISIQAIFEKEAERKKLTVEEKARAEALMKSKLEDMYAGQALDLERQLKDDQILPFSYMINDLVRVVLERKY